MIKVNVFTNQDNIECFVNTFISLPRIGDKVLVRYRNDYSTTEIYSKVVSVNHRVDVQGQPFVEIELWSESIHQRNKKQT